MSNEIRPISYGHDMYYQTRSNRTKSKMFKTDFWKRLHEIRLIKYDLDMQYLLNMTQ